MVKIKTKLADRNNYGVKRSTSNIKYIVVHYTGNDGDSDESNSNYFNTRVTKTSAHYYVDDDSITKSVPDDYVAYSVGGAKYSNYTQTGGAKLYGKCTNSNSISIELCDSKKDGKVYPTAKTITNALDLTQSLMKKYNIPVSNVIRHFDVNGKSCPAYWCGNSNKDKLWLTEFRNKLTTTTTATSSSTSSSSSTSKESQQVTNIKTYQKWLNTNFRTGLTVDGKFGKNTLKASVKAWQTTMNKNYKTKLTVDGIFGNKCYEVANKALIKKSSKNTFVYIAQGILNAKGYVCSIDGVYGDNTTSNIKKYQTSRKLTSDGICGANTWKSLLS